ncbi:MAG: AI-2E family transporter [Magnetococcales bacterium]|nr:AI-2E family transporter [Magnetococcales bacterium]MBF0151878.1 AI-2E family transporter [Magnetococcales bacterium]MBF0175134.1 AI-2E family transporter [Magnetococcales bacterium]MBF0347044.1 AI-2E family transporter [Magnetococcales bacterium]MBF0632918.1 AI-2E family transporter [Magnetococcales bacterium]
MSEFFSSILRRLGNPQISGLILAMVVAAGGIIFFGKALAPYLSALILAYLLEGMIQSLIRIRLPRLVAVIIVFSVFFLVLNLLLFALLPTLLRELIRISQEIPHITQTLKELTVRLSEYVSGWGDSAFAENILLGLVERSQQLAGYSVTFLLQGLPGVISVVVYLVLVPFLVFFFMKDKKLLLDSFVRYMPKNRDLINRVLVDVDTAVGGYVRGKFWELLVLGGTSYTAFLIIDFKYALLVGILTGVSVLIPILGLVVVAIPVVVLGIFQWGLTLDAINPLIIYTVLQVVDGNILAPMILGETVKIHPTTIMLAVLFFGSIWGLAGVFFAVPLWVLLKSVADAILFSEEGSSLIQSY